MISHPFYHHPTDLHFNQFISDFIGKQLFQVGDAVLTAQVKGNDLRLCPVQQPGSLRQLLTAVVEREVDRYNKKDTESQMIPYLTVQQIDDQAVAGKVSFGTIFSDKKANKQKAVENAIQCWQDGMVRVFMNETELTELDASLSIPENAEFTFIRLTFLAGRMW